VCEVIKVRSYGSKFTPRRETSPLGAVFGLSGDAAADHGAARFRLVAVVEPATGATIVKHLGPMLGFLDIFAEKFGKNWQ
jgi:hypothetical protein